MLKRKKSRTPMMKSAKQNSYRDNIIKRNEKCTLLESVLVMKELPTVICYMQMFIQNFFKSSLIMYVLHVPVGYTAR